MHSDQLIKLFWSKVDRRGPDECWLWTAGKDSFGYGLLYVGGRKQRAPRLSYEINVGPAPSDMWVLHHCDNPSCVNPAHLWLGTCADNVYDRQAKGRGNFRPGPANPSAKLKPGQVVEIRRLYASGGYSHRQLAKLFGIGKTQVYSILNRLKWR